MLAIVSSDKKGTFNSKGGYFIKNDLSMFDASFFEITKKEAESMGRSDASHPI